MHAVGVARMPATRALANAGLQMPRTGELREHARQSRKLVRHVRTKAPRKASMLIKESVPSKGLGDTNEAGTTLMRQVRH